MPFVLRACCRSMCWPADPAARHAACRPGFRVEIRVAPKLSGYAPSIPDIFRAGSRIQPRGKFRNDGCRFFLGGCSGVGGGSLLFVVSTLCPGRHPERRASQKILANSLRGGFGLGRLLPTLEAGDSGRHEGVRFPGYVARLRRFRTARGGYFRSGFALKIEEFRHRGG